MAILYPASLTNLVVEVGTRHCHQTLLVHLMVCRHQAIIWTKAGLLLIGSLRTNFEDLCINAPTDNAKYYDSKGHFLYTSVSITHTQDIFSLADATRKHSKYPCFCILPLEFGVNIDMHKHENSEVIYSNRNKSPKGMSGNSRLQKHGNMLIDFIWLNVQAKYLIHTILYHFKWDMALWKWPKCPQYMQRTWW